MEAHITNLFKHGVNEYDRTNKTQGPNILGVSVFRQAYSRANQSFFGIEVSDKFFRVWVDIGRPEIITYSRVQEDEKGKPVRVKRANSSLIGFMHEEQGLILLFPNTEAANEGMKRLVEEYPSLTADEHDPKIMSGVELANFIEDDKIDDFINLYNLQNTDEIGHRVLPDLGEIVFMNAPPALPGKGLYWAKQREAKPVNTTVEQEAQVDEDVKF